ncbi:aminotransferase class V-fold PLP-dependent enzyme [Longispora fulva]|uniref:Probable hercynylcysteine sulfoxide lyase n=1 Tax=Longispora fulva TaxID=619741 RepID=A0A8J7GQG1_9ACTN|nr:aminotransferase class V-fold PLP-dependent enzyme [Longispora fulva]MBG6141443.1 cysteine desulfurase [Longispora fulva]
MIDLDRVVRDTPAAAHGVFLDSAGSSLPPSVVVETVAAHQRREAQVGGYRAAEERAADLAAVRTSLGLLLNVPVGTLALTDSATRAWTQFFYAVPLAPGDRILLCGVEYASNAVAALQRAAATGATVEYVPSDPTGQIDLDALAGMLDDRVRVVSLVHVPTNGGLVNPVREVVDLAHAHGALVLLDACQSLGQLRVDATALGVDALSGTGRKWLRGPRGTGFLYVRPGLVTALEPPVIDLFGASWTGRQSYALADDATRFELWESDVAGRLGLGAAVDYLLALGPDAVESAVTAHAATLRGLLAEIPGVTVRDRGVRRCGLVTFSVEGRDPAEVKAALRARDVTLVTTRRKSTLIDMTERGLEQFLRASPHYFLGPDQLATAARAVADLAR